MPGLPTEYLKRAEEYRRLAGTTTDPLIAARLIELAEQYEEEAQDPALRELAPRDR
jgi:hypothetical protein